MPSDKRSRQRAGRDARMAELRRAQRRRQNYRRGGVVAVIVVVFVALAFILNSGGGSKKKAVNVGSSTTVAGSSTTVGSATTVAGSATTVGKTPPTVAPVVGGKISGATACPKADGSSAKITTFAQAPPSCLDAGKTYTATFATNVGNIVVALNTTKTPETANNFIVLSRYHYYDGTAMFRTDTSIGIIQGGSPTTQSASDPGPGYTIKDEGSGYKYAAGDLVMARTSAANSAGAQYFFCVNAACSGLNSSGTYVVFGATTSGLDVLQKILASNVDENNGLGGAPDPAVVVKSLTISET